MVKKKPAIYSIELVKCQLTSKDGKKGIRKFVNGVLINEGSFPLIFDTQGNDLTDKIWTYHRTGKGFTGMYWK